MSTGFIRGVGFYKEWLFEDLGYMMTGLSVGLRLNERWIYMSTLYVYAQVRTAG